MEIEIECDRNDCKNCREGKCICERLIIRAQLKGRSPGSEGTYYYTFFTCGSYEHKS